MTPFRTRSAARALLPALCLLATLLGASLPAQAQSRGELLYVTHCSGCHSSQMHWRDKKQVTDWPSLLAQVRYWQAQALLSWPDDDVTQVAAYLNAAYYRLSPQTVGKLASR